MDGFFGNFIEHGGQIVSLATVAIVWLAFSALGALACGPQRFREATPLCGWAVVSVIFTLGGVFTAVSFTYLAVGTAGLAVLGAIITFRRGDRIFPRGFFKIVALTLPLLVLVSAMVGSQWDEFSQWLISPRQILELDAFPDRTNKHLGGTHPDYPFGWQLITYLTSRLAGRLVENSGSLVNVLLLLSFGLVVVRLIREALDSSDDASDPNWGLYAIAALSVTLLNPTFAQKVVLTSYADTATAVCVGFGAVLGWRMLDTLARGNLREAHRLAFQIGLIMLVLVNLKQSTVVLFIIVVGAIILTGLRDSEVRNGDIFRTLPAMVLPGIVIYVVWGHYVRTELEGAVLSVRPIDQWYIDLIPQIIWKMLVVFSKKGAYFVLMFVAAVFAFRGMIRLKTPLDRLAIIVGAIFLGYNAFLLFTYVSVFSERDALRAVSLWRYNMHLGPLGVAFAAYGLVLLWKKYRLSERLGGKGIGWVPVVLVLVAPFVFAHKLRFDRHPPIPHFRAVSADLKGMIKKGDKLFVVDPRESGASGIIARYELLPLGAFSGWHGVFHPRSEDIYRNIFFKNSFSHLLVYSTVPVMLKVIDMALEERTTYLLRSDGKGGWRVQHRWKAP